MVLRRALIYILPNYTKATAAFANTDAHPHTHPLDSHVTLSAPAFPMDIYRTARPTSSLHNNMQDIELERPGRQSEDSPRSSTSSLFEKLDQINSANRHEDSADTRSLLRRNVLDQGRDLEEGANSGYKRPTTRSSKIKKWVLRVGVAAIIIWVIFLLSLFAIEFTRPTASKEAATETTLLNSKPKPILSPTGGDATNYADNDFKLVVTPQTVRTGTFRAERKNVQWIQAADLEGAYLVRDRKYVVKSYGKDSKEIEITDTTVTYKDKHLQIDELWVRPDLKKALLVSDRKKNYRHSSFGNYWLLDVESKTVEPLLKGKDDARIAVASWAPNGKSVAFVYDNNVYVTHVDNYETYQVTDDGSDQIFNGRPDWVYEEEVLSGDSALWWSPDGKHLAFLRSDDTDVQEFTIPYYVQDPKPQAYPEMRSIKYPKPGSPNPDVQMLFYNVEQGATTYIDKLLAKDDIISDVTWSKTGTALIRASDREADILKIVHVDANNEYKAKILRENNVKELDGGWVETVRSAKIIPKNDTLGLSEEGYIDTIIKGGRNHLAYFVFGESEPKVVLTSGDWEVVDAPSSYDASTGTVYFLSTQKDPTERHLYSVQIDGSDLKPITNVTEDAYFGVSFSSDARFALLNYDGPEVPYQKIIDLHSSDPLAAEKVVKNEFLESTLATYALPTSHFSQVNLGTKDKPIVANAVEIRPPHFDESKEYPVLFFVYGGPGSQTVAKRFNIDFQKSVAASLGYIVVSVDGRGTGYMGREFLSVVRDDIGRREAADQISAAKLWAQKPYVDENHIAIWGWSYGGYCTLKTLEADAGQTFRFGMAVAPVTDWRFYDSVYTERYMHTPQNNKAGYEETAVHNMTALGSNERFLVMHGSGDDNVHMQNTLSLVDNLDIAGIENYDMHIYPDSDHSIYFHNAQAMVYDRLYIWIQRAFNDEFSHL